MLHKFLLPLCLFKYHYQEQRENYERLTGNFGGRWANHQREAKIKVLKKYGLSIYLECSCRIRNRVRLLRGGPWALGFSKL